MRHRYGCTVAAYPLQNPLPIAGSIKEKEMKKFFLLPIFYALALLLRAQSPYPELVIETNYGTMRAVLYEDTPNHSSHFLKLVKEGYFNGTLFHRVIKDFMIQGGAQDSRNAPAGAVIGGGRTDMEILPEIRANRFHKKGALAAPRRDDNVNPQRKSDASQFYIADGKQYSTGRLDSMEMRVNIPIKNRIIREHYTPRKPDLEALRSNPPAFNRLLDSLLHTVDSLYAAAPGKLVLDPALREAYSTVGGVHHLDGNYTVFGEITEGLEVIDKIAAIPVDANNRPKSDARIIRIYTAPRP